MKTAEEFRLAAENCRLLAHTMADPDHARKLVKLASEFDAMAEAEDAARAAANADAARLTD